MQPSTDALGPVLTLTEPLFVLTTSAFLVALAAKRVSLSFDRIYILFGLYAAALTVSAIFSVDPKHSFFRLLGEFYLIALAVLTVNIVRTHELMRKVVLFWLAASGISAAIGTIAVACFYLGVKNFLTDIAFHYYGTLPPGNYVRIQSTFLYPSMLCNYLTVSFMMLLAARRLGWIGKTLFIFLLLTFSITAAFTFTPGLGGLILAVAIWMWLLQREQGRAFLSKAALIVGIAAAIAFQAISTFTPITLETSPYFFYLGGVRFDPTPRLLVWTDAFSTFLSYPFFGKGIGEQVAAVTYMVPDGRMQLATDAHNVWLSVAAQAGMLGLASLVVLVVTIVRRALPLDLTNDQALRTALGIAFISAFIVQGMVGSFEDARHLWVLIGLVLSPAFRRPARGEGPAEAGTQNATTALP